MPIVQQRRGTAASLQTVTLAAGQIAYETDTGKIKVGDGTTVYSGLEYVTDASNISDGAITTAKIADAGITTAKLADSSVTAAKIAGNAVTSDKFADGTVSTAKLADDAVTTAKIGNLAVGTAQIVDGAVTSGKIADGTITAQDMATHTVDSARIAPDAVVESKIADDAVTTSKIAANAVTNTEIAANTILTGNIASGAINTQSIASDAVTSAKIATDAVTNLEIAANAVDSGEIAANAITEAKIADDAVTYAKIQNVGAGKILGNTQATAGIAEEISSTSYGRSLLNVADAATLASTLGAATTSDITTAINNLIDSAPGTLDTLNELAAALGDDANFSTTITNSVSTNTSNISANTSNISTNTSNITANQASLALKMPLAGGTFTGDVTIGQSSTGGAVDIILPRQSTSTKHQIRFLHNNTDGFSNPANELDFIRLYTDSTNWAGMGISSGHMNIGTKGSISMDIYTDGSIRTEYDHAGEVTHYTDHNFGTNVNIGGRLEVPRGNNPGTPVIVSEYNGSVDTNSGIYFPAGDEVAISIAGSEQVHVTGTALQVNSGAIHAPTYRVDGSSNVAGSTTSVAIGQTGDSDTGIYFPAANQTAVVSAGNNRVNFNANASLFYRNASQPTIKADTSQSGYMIIDSAGSYLSLNHYVGDDILLCYTTGGSGNVIIGASTTTNPNPSSHKLLVYGASASTGANYADEYRSTSNGTKSDTAYGMHSDVDTGIYFPAANELNVSAGDKDRIKFSATTTTVYRETGVASLVSEGNWFIIDSGSSGVALNYYNSANVYLAFGGGDVVIGNVSNTNNRRLLVGGTAETTGSLYLPDGTLGSPALSFSSDTNTGIYLNAADELSLVAGGDEVLRLTATEITTNEVFTTTNAIKLPVGSASSASLQYSGNAGTGVYFPSSTEVGVAVNGARKFNVSTAAIKNYLPVKITDGTASSPAIQFTSDTDTGIKRNSNGNFDIVTAGAERLSITLAGDIHTASGRTVFLNGSISDGTTTKTTTQVLEVVAAGVPPSSYGQNLLFG